MRDDSLPRSHFLDVKGGGTIFLTIVYRRKEGEKSTLMMIAGAKEEHEEARELKP